ncbi:hypothetical protein [Geomonas sp.]|uniref:hypothetical protein n=1 Tax=Geomonas sp. TaxID=2651584 RepID=UPI002B480FFC|nr:hypothetical protein [Geomonas sp.]HJV34717.1 hypothetical protein [Geomonas sp.]
MALMIFVRRALLAFALIVLPVPALAASQLTISSSGGGVFAVTGSLEGVAGVQMSISYDNTVLSNPVISLGDLITAHGMVGVPNPRSNPIVIAAVSVSGVTAKGTIATITFNTVTPSSGGILSISGTAIDANRRPVRISFFNNAASPAGSSDVATTGGSTPVVSGSGDGSGSNGNAVGTSAGSGGNSGGGTQPTPKTTNSTGSASTPVVLGGAVTLPPSEIGAGSQENRGTAAQLAEQQDNQPKAATTEPNNAEKVASPPQVGQGEATASKVAAPAASPIAPQPVESVLERFRLFKGEKTIRNLTALFDRDPAAPFTQIPAIAIADGKATVRVVVSNLSGDKAPTFSLTSAEYVTSRRLADGEWEIEVRPDKGAVKAIVKLFYNGVTQELPLAVTPKVDVALLKKGEVSEGDFLVFLTQRGTAAEPKFDLNRDGKRDYVDDYIFTANYLVQTGRQAGQQLTPPSKQ